MANALEKAFAQLEKTVEKYCRGEKKEKVHELVLEALFYAEDFPQKADIEKAIALVKRAETYMTVEGKPHYEKASNQVITKLMALLEKNDSPTRN